MLAPASAHAATITVTTEADASSGDGLCSLREAISAADTDAPGGECAAGSGADVIALPAGFYSLSASGLDEDANALVATDAAGNRSAPKRVKFKIVRRTRHTRAG